MNKEFCTYEQARALKELGFDEPCIAGYQLRLATLFSEIPHTMNGNIHKNSEGITTAPLYQQAFRWFRDKHKVGGEIFSQLRPNNNFKYGFRISGSDTISDGFKTYDEAESACLDKLIEIIKNKNE
jgi:hypothetical protein